jgi:lysozyme
MTLLRVGSSGEEVRRVQRALNRLGARLDVDGVYGKATEAAVRGFQSSHGLGVDGIVGPVTGGTLFTGQRQAVGAARAATVSAQLVAAVAQFEGGRAPDGRFHPYYDRAGAVWTIGYGHTEGVSATSRPLTSEEARHLLETDLNSKYLPAVARLALSLNQKQLDALASFVYNVGPGYLDAGHTMGDALRRQDWAAAARAFLLYDKAGGKALPGLTRRRRWESQLFSGGSYAV